jgi:hypothetical protein
MNSSLIGKIEKAKRYAQEPERVTFSDFSLSFRGDHDYHNLTFKDNHWHCSCSYFASHGLCSHTMALEKILGEMLPKGIGSLKEL